MKIIRDNKKYFLLLLLAIILVFLTYNCIFRQATIEALSPTPVPPHSHKPDDFELNLECTNTAGNVSCSSAKVKPHSPAPVVPPHHLPTKPPTKPPTTPPTKPPTTPPTKPPTKPRPPDQCWLVPNAVDPYPFNEAGVAPVGTWAQRTQALINWADVKSSTPPYVYPTWKCWNPGQIAPATGNKLGPAVKGSKPQSTCNLANTGWSEHDCSDYDMTYACAGESGTVYGLNSNINTPGVTKPAPLLRYMTGKDLAALSGPTASTCVKVPDTVNSEGIHSNAVVWGNPEEARNGPHPEYTRAGPPYWTNDPTCGGFCKKQ